MVTNILVEIRNCSSRRSYRWSEYPKCDLGTQWYKMIYQTEARVYLGYFIISVPETLEAFRSRHLSRYGFIGTDATFLSELRVCLLGYLAHKMFFQYEFAFRTCLKRLAAPWIHSFWVVRAPRVVWTRRHPVPLFSRRGLLWKRNVCNNRAIQQQFNSYHAFIKPLSRDLYCPWVPV